MSFTEKVDVLDLIIKTMEEHEKRLDELVSTLETVATVLAAYQEGKA